MAYLHASLDSTCGKVEFQKCPPDVRSWWGVHSTNFDPELRNEFKFFSNPGVSIQWNGPIHKI